VSKTVTPLILIADDEELNREYISELLEEKGYRCETACDGIEALVKLKANHFDLLLTDLNMPRMNGLELLAKIRDDGLAVTSILITAFGSIEAAVEALKLGAVDFLEKPTGGGLGPRLQLAVEKALGRRRLVHRNQALEEALQPGGQDLIGVSSQMEELRDKCHRLGDSGKTVLILGETGTGKELVARSIHRGGNRRHKPFVAINCAVLSRELLSSELFGHVKGSFSGAVSDRVGKFEAAAGGTLFLDEIGEMDLELQSRLLRVIETREFERLGSNTTIRIDVRILTATHRPLEEEIGRGTFREDLYHRLNVISLRTPNLREVPGDIPILARHFLALDPEGRGLTFGDEALARLAGHRWPGNMRELRHVVEQAVFQAEGSTITAEDLLLPVARTGDGSPVPIDQEHLSLAEVEREVVISRLKLLEGNRRRTARSLGIAESTLYKKLKEFGLN
jgi:DNA-binding NtrC family response regulator